MANILDLQFNLTETVDEISSLPTEHWECWIIQLLMELGKKAADQGKEKEFRKMLTAVQQDITKILGEE